MSSLLPISLTARPNLGQRYAIFKRKSEFKSLRKTVLGRDEYACAYCGFFSEQYQTITDPTFQYKTLKPDAYVTTCSLCVQCHFLDNIGQDGHSGGQIIYLPEVSQADLHHFCRALFCSMLRDAPYKGKLQTTYLSLKDRGQPVEAIFGPGSSDAKSFGQCLMDAQSHHRDQSPHPILNDLKLLPLRRYFTTEIQYWKQTVFANMPL